MLAAGGPFSESLNYYSIAGQDTNYQRYLKEGKGDFLMGTTENNAAFLVGNFFLLASVMGFIITKPWKK